MFLGFDNVPIDYSKDYGENSISKLTKVVEAIQSTCILEIKHMSGLR